MNKINILLVDDHLMFLEGLQSLFTKEENINVIGTASNVNQALAIMSHQQTDIVITDLSMPEIDGSSFVDIIKERYPTVNILILSMHSEPHVILKLIKQKVNGYLLKNAQKHELLNAVKTICNGENYFSREVKGIISESTFSRTYTPIPELSKREKEVLCLIGDEYTTKEIADKLFISQNTVESHRRNMFSKLCVKNVAGLIRIAIKNNLLET